MASTYSEFANQVRSQKIVLCHIEPKQRLAVFTLDSGTIYKKSVDYFVVNVSEDSSDLTEASSASLSSGEWFFDAINGELYVNTTDNSDPKTKKIIVTYRLFYSNLAIDLPYDLDSGLEVHYDGRLKSNSPINKQLDEEQIGIVLETSTNVRFDNQDGFFDDFYDVLIFENKSIKIWSWSETLPLAEKRKIFDGVIQNKSYSNSDIRFSCKDLIFNLRKPLNYKTFTSIDGDIPDQFLFTPKRVIFGEVIQARCVPTDAINDGYDLTGTASVLATNQAQLIGSGTAFLDEVSPSDEIILIRNNVEFKQTVKSVDSDTQITFEENFPLLVNNQSFINKPQKAYRKKNRIFNIAGHKLRSPASNITSIEQPNRFAVLDASEFFAGDNVFIRGESAIIRRVSGNNIVLRNNLSFLPTTSDTMTKNPVKRVFYDGIESFINRDFTVNNTDDGAELIFNNLFEFNIAPVETLDTSLIFTNGSRTVTVDSGDPRNEISIKDWIRSGDDSHAVFYEVLQVTETEVILREPYAGATNTSIGSLKSVNIINDNSIITVNCLGLDFNDKWIKTASDCVEYLLKDDAGLTNLNNQSFIDSNVSSNSTISLVTPSRIGGNKESIRSVISKINQSVFGSLIIDNDFNFKYSILNADRSSSITQLKDDDILNTTISVRNRNEIVRQTNAKYKFFKDKFTGDDAFILYEYENDFVDDLIGTDNELDVELFLFDDNYAQTIAQRYSYYNSLSQSIFTIKGKLNLSDFELNTVFKVNLDRIYKRFGSLSTQKVGIISKVTNNGSDISVDVNDLGNTFNRTGVIADNAAPDFTSSSDDEKIIYGYIVDNDFLTPDSSDDSSIYGNQIG